MDNGDPIDGLIEDTVRTIRVNGIDTPTPIISALRAVGEAAYGCLEDDAERMIPVWQSALTAACERFGWQAEVKLEDVTADGIRPLRLTVKPPASLDQVWIGTRAE
jgi:hypothetical protein